jgi:hypothetical protein
MPHEAARIVDEQGGTGVIQTNENTTVNNADTAAG